MDLTEKQVSSEEIYNGRTFRVTVDKISKADGSLSKREVVVHNGAAAVVALDTNNNIYLVRQYRYAQKRELLEIPAGKINPNEEPRDAAKRELSEETGMVSDDFSFLGMISPTPGYSSENIWIYLAKDCHYEGQHLDPGEFLNVEIIPFNDFYQSCLFGDVQDGKTLIGVLKAKALNL